MQTVQVRALLGSMPIRVLGHKPKLSKLNIVCMQAAGRATRMEVV